MRSAVATLTVGNCVFLWGNLVSSVHRSQVFSSLEEAVGVQILGPFQMNGARDTAPSRGSHELAGVFIVASRIDENRIGRVQLAQDVFGRSEQLPARLHLEVAGLWNCRITGHGKSGRGPGVEAAVEDM